MNLSKLTLSLTALMYAGYGVEALADEPEILRVIDQNQAGSATSCLVMSQNPDTAGVTDKALKNLVEVTNLATGKKVDAGVLINGRNLCVSDLDFGTDYRVTVKSGLKTAQNTRLTHDVSVEFKTSDHQPVISFRSGNIISAASKEKKVAVETVNHDSFRAVLYRISKNDLPGYLSKATSELEYRWELTDYLRNHGIFEGSKVYRVNSNANKKQVTLVDINDISAGAGAGVYVLIITDREECADGDECITYASDHFESMFLAKSVVVTDIGMTTYRRNGGIDVAVRSLSSAKPLAGLKATLLSTSSEVLATAVTDRDGYAHFNRKAVSGTNALTPAVINVSGNNDFYSQDLRLSPLYLEGVKTYDEDAIDSDYNVFAYTDRTMVRPGETVNYHAIVRNKNFRAADLKALKLMVYRPDGLLYQEIPLSNPAAGAFDYDFAFDEHAGLGNWKFVLGFDKKVTLASTKVLVDNFIPSSIETEVSDVGRVLPDNGAVKVSAKYTYGAPAPDINVSGYYSVEPDNHPVEAFKDYYFGVNSRQFSEYTVPGNLEDAVTGANGELLISFNPSNFSGEYPQKIRSVINFLDPNSKVLGRVAEFRVPFKKPIVGIKTDFDKGDQLTSDFSVILADQAGTLHEGRVEYSIFRRNVSYQFVHNSNGWYYLRNEFLSPVTAGTLDLKADAQSGRIKYKFDGGSYVIRLNHDGLETSTDFYAGSCSEMDPKYPDRFELYTDRKVYKAGETAYLEFDSGYDGYADLMFDTPVPEMVHYEIKKGHNKLPLKLGNGFVRGSYAVLSTYASAESRHLGTLRSIGIAYIEPDTSAATLTVSADVPEKVKPNSGLDITVKVDNADKDTYVAASLIDRGILSINGQKAPHPEKTMYSHRYFDTAILDPYAYVMKNVNRDGQGYGDDVDEFFVDSVSLSNITDNMLSHHIARVKVENGQAKLHYDLKDVSSTAALMITAWSPDKLGSYERDVVIRDSAVSRLIMPYYLHKGDSIEAQLSVNNLSGKAGTYTYGITCRGSLKCGAEGKVDVADGGIGTVPVTVTAENTEPGYIKLDVKSDGYGFSTEKEVSVINPLTKAGENKIIVLAPGQKKNIVFVNQYADGADAVVKFGRFPLSDTSEIVKDVLSDNSMFSGIYTQVSNGLTLLTVLNGMEKSGVKDNAEIRDIRKYLSDRVSLIESRFDAYGSLSDVPYSYDENQYAYAYASLFLIEANNSGFGVSRTVLDIAKTKLMELQNNGNENVASLAMYALARMGVNVKTNAVYRFDALNEKEDQPVESFAHYADIFGLYGDKTRRTAALERGIGLLASINAKYNNTRTLSARVLDDVGLAKKLLGYFPFNINYMNHEVLALIRSSMKAGYSEGLDNLYGYLNADEYYTAACQYLIADISTINRTPASTERLKVANNTVTVENKSSETAIATVTVDDYVQKLPIATGGITVSQRYYDSTGKELRGPISLKVNEEILVVKEFKSNSLFRGVVTSENKLPTNTVLVRVYNGSDEDRLAGKVQKGSIGYPTVTKGDTGFVTTHSVYGTQSVTVAYVIKGAHKGSSVALMTGSYLDQLGTRMYLSYDPAVTITVK